jgi:4-hydroxy-2-oxoglutarate aldolase
MLLEGLQLPLTTPFYPDGRLNLLKLEHNVARYSKTPVAGLVALSHGGEPTMLSEEETRLALRCVSDAAAVTKVLIAGVSRDSVRSTLDLAESAAKFGYDAVLIHLPSLLGAGEGSNPMSAMLTYFQTVADRSSLPVVLYNPVSAQTRRLPLEALLELAGHPQIIGLVDAGGKDRIEAIKADTTYIKREVTVTPVFAAVTRRMQTLHESAAEELISANTLSGSAAVAVSATKSAAKTRTKSVGFQILAGTAASVLQSLQAGAVGAMPALAASVPQACYEVLAAWKDGDEGLAEEKQIRLQDVAGKVEEQLGVAGIKFGCDLNGYFGGVPRLPLLPLTGADRSEVEALMQDLRH